MNLKIRKIAFIFFMISFNYIEPRFAGLIPNQDDGVRSLDDTPPVQSNPKTDDVPLAIGDPDQLPVDQKLQDSTGSGDATIKPEDGAATAAKSPVDTPEETGAGLMKESGDALVQKKTNDSSSPGNEEMTSGKAAVEAEAAISSNGSGSAVDASFSDLKDGNIKSSAALGDGTITEKMNSNNNDVDNITDQKTTSSGAGSDVPKEAIPETGVNSGDAGTDIEGKSTSAGSVSDKVSSNASVTTNNSQSNEGKTLSSNEASNTQDSEAKKPGSDTEVSEVKANATLNTKVTQVENPPAVTNDSSATNSTSADLKTEHIKPVIQEGNQDEIVSEDLKNTTDGEQLAYVDNPVPNNLDVDSPPVNGENEQDDTKKEPSLVGEPGQEFGKTTVEDNMLDKEYLENNDLDNPYSQSSSSHVGNQGDQDFSSYSNDVKPKLPSSEVEIREENIDTGGKFNDDRDSHFFAYFLTVMVIAVVFYLVFHNKKKIIALTIEGRNHKSRRRGSGRTKYHKLDNNLDEAISSTKSEGRTYDIIY